MVFAFDLRLKKIGDFLFALGAHTLLVLCLQMLHYMEQALQKVQHNFNMIS